MIAACLHCGRPFDPDVFPLARPRRDGTRGHFAYCADCLSASRWPGSEHPLAGGGRHAVNRARRNLRRRQAYARWAA